MSAPEPRAMSAVSFSPVVEAVVEVPASLTDVRFALLVSGALFVLSAWPLLLVALPPFQDLPNHVATAHIVAHPELYPEFAFNGLFKSNSLLTLWFWATGSHGLFGAARAFTALTLAANALALPFFVLHFAGRRAVLVAALFLWPLVHSFTVSMGFLNFAFAFALSLILLIAIDLQQRRPSLGRGGLVALLAVGVWYAHPFPVAVMGALVAVHVACRPSWHARFTAGLRLLLPLAPAGLLSLLAAQHHLVKAENSSAAAASYMYLNPWKIVQHFWLDVSGAFTYWGSMTAVPAILLPLFAWKRRRVERPFFSWPALVGLTVVYVGLPVMLSNWNYLNCRLVPFLWVGLALRLPTRLPRRLAVGLATCAVAFSAVMGIDYLRLDRDRAEFTAGIEAVPEQATLLPLLFKHNKTSEFTASLTHAWGYYTVAKNTSAPLVFGVERSYPITYRDFPPGKFIPPALDRFAERNATPERLCKLIGETRADMACLAAWREIWSGFWRDAEPRFSHVLTWAMPPEARAMIPGRYHRVFAQGDLEIYAREGPSKELPALR